MSNAQVAHELTMAILNKLDLSNLTSQEIVDMYQKKYDEILTELKEKRPDPELIRKLT